ncbi:copper resistance D family protein [Gordonia sp. CPCC 205333]|uniref:copper resistance D family protein n=1 Tax=Gordonia sp. CPCC 205333 TaxID=3140790 RepID=UPI003AF33219
MDVAASGLGLTMSNAAGNSAPLTVRRRATLLGAAVPAAFAGLLTCWLLADPTGPGLASTAGVVALIAGVALVGLGCLPLLGAQPSLAAIAGFALVWLVADVIVTWFDVASRAGIPVASVRVGQFVDGVTSSPGEVISGVVAMAIIGWALLARRTAEPVIPVTVVGALAGLGIVAPAVTGHAATHTMEPILVVAHVLCAAWWCGSLAAMAMTVTSRNGWRTVLPAFSRHAPIAVGILTVTGLASGAIELGFDADWWTTGYGQVMLAKTLGLAALIGLGAWHRRHWVPEVMARRGTVERSLRSAVVEVALMCVVLGLAAGLASTSPLG